MKKQKHHIPETKTPKTDNFTISEEQKALVNDEIRKVDEDPNYALDWEMVNGK